jgi:hypothetical protein
MRLNDKGKERWNSILKECVSGNWADDFGWWHSFSAMCQGHYAILFLNNILCSLSEAQFYLY